MSDNHHKTNIWNVWLSPLLFFPPPPLLHAEWDEETWKAKMKITSCQRFLWNSTFSYTACFVSQNVFDRFTFFFFLSFLISFQYVFVSNFINERRILLLNSVEREENEEKKRKPHSNYNELWLFFLLLFFALNRKKKNKNSSDRECISVWKLHNKTKCLSTICLDWVIKEMFGLTS